MNELEDRLDINYDIQPPLGKIHCLEANNAPVAGVFQNWIPEGQNEAIALRLQAAWNFCRSIPTEKLEDRGGVALQTLATKVADLRAEVERKNREITELSTQLDNALECWEGATQTHKQIREKYEKQNNELQVLVKGMLPIHEPEGFVRRLLGMSMDDRDYILAISAKCQREDHEIERLREPVRWFAGEMEKKLKANDWKRQWPKMANRDLIDLMDTQIPLMVARIIAGDCDEVIHRAVNVANYVMMLADKARAALAEKEDI